MSGILFVHFRRNDSLLPLLHILEHIHHEQRSEPKAFAERGFDLRSGKSAVLVTVLVEQLPDLRVLFKDLGFDAVYIRDNLLKPVVGDGRFTRCDIAVVKLFDYAFHLVSPICEHKKMTGACPVIRSILFYCHCSTSRS